MAAYDMLIGLVKTYFKELNYKEEFIDDFFSSKNFSEILAIKLANSNVVIKNKTYPSSKQTHIAITGEAIDYFYGPNDLTTKDNDVVDKKSVVVSAANISQLNGLSYELLSTNEIELIFGSILKNHPELTSELMPVLSPEETYSIEYQTRNKSEIWLSNRNNQEVLLTIHKRL